MHHLAVEIEDLDQTVTLGAVADDCQFIVGNRGRVGRNLWRAGLENRPRDRTR